MKILLGICLGTLFYILFKYIWYMSNKTKILNIVNDYSKLKIKEFIDYIKNSFTEDDIIKWGNKKQNDYDFQKEFYNYFILNYEKGSSEEMIQLGIDFYGIKFYEEKIEPIINNKINELNLYKLLDKIYLKKNIIDEIKTFIISSDFSEFINNDEYIKMINYIQERRE